MQSWLDWLVANKEWVFSGIGISVITVMVLIVHKVFFPTKVTSTGCVNQNTQGDNSPIISGNQAPISMGSQSPISVNPSQDKSS